MSITSPANYCNTESTVMDQGLYEEGPRMEGLPYFPCSSFLSLTAILLPIPSLPRSSLSPRYREATHHIQLEDL